MTPAPATSPGTAIPCLSAASFEWPFRHRASAWTGHVPFAFWLVDTLRPRVVVELGTFTGMSFFAFCQAAAATGERAELHAVDTWRGDAQSGFYGDEVHEDAARYAAARYPELARLHRTTFDAALDLFADGSIDLLHIDGCHTYEAVRHDYEAWRPKLSARGVVLFHDVAVERDDFGVGTLWAELAARHPAFAFRHSHGLGVLAPGEEVPDALGPLFALGEVEGDAVRLAYARLGGVVAERVETLRLERARRRAAAAPVAQTAADPAGAGRAGAPDAGEAGARERGLYLDLMVKILANTIYEDPEQTPDADAPFARGRRVHGRDWPRTAHSMIGVKRLNNLRNLCERAILDQVPGDFIETGIWRGGACILMSAVLAAHGDTARRVFCADSFRGLPEPDLARYPQDAGDTHHEMGQLAIPVDQVRRHFAAYGLLSDQVRFVEGWFADTLPPPEAERFAVIRLDGDMYGSTMDAITRLYDKLSVGGFLIVDDYGAVEGARRAIDDFRSERGIVSPIVTIDWTGVWWRKRADEPGAGPSSR